MTEPARSPFSAAPSGSLPATVLGVDGGHRDRAHLEHVVAEQVRGAGLPAPLLLGTHAVRIGEAHHSVSLRFPDGTAVGTLVAGLVARGFAVADGDGVTGPAELGPGAESARAALLARDGGRLVRFPGRDRLRGRMTVAQVLATGAVDRVEPLGPAVAPDTVVDTRDFTRPVLRAGELVLEVTPAAGGVVIPLELEHQHVCGH